MIGGGRYGKGGGDVTSPEVEYRNEIKELERLGVAFAYRIVYIYQS